MRTIKCYVIMPFGEQGTAEAYEAWDRYQSIICKGVDDANRRSAEFVCELIRADESPPPGPIPQHVFQNLKDADIVIADLKGARPNVLYELGIRHCYRNGTIVLCPDDESARLPLYLSQDTVIPYGNRGEAVRALSQRIVNVVASLSANKPGAADSPVLRANLGVDPPTPGMQFDPIARAFAKEVARHFREDQDWTGDWDQRSVFQERESHFREEKDAIAEAFVPVLVERCRYFLEQDSRRRVYLVVDSGTGCAAVLKSLAQRLTRENGRWDRLRILTNNIPGLGRFMTYGRKDPNNRQSDLVVECNCLPGIVRSEYSAVLGNETEKALKFFHSQREQRDIFIGLLTGNWVGIDFQKKIPVPLARGLGHLDFKQVIANVCDEAYVLAPLAKNFRNLVTKKKIEEVLGTAYDPLKLGGKATLRLVSTLRVSKALLTEHGESIRRQLDAKTSQDALKAIQGGAKSVPHIMDLFPSNPGSRFPADTGQQRFWEYPHPETRLRTQFLEHFEQI